MKNITEYNEFKNSKKITEQVEVEVKPTEILNEGAQLYDDTWKSRMRVDIPVSLINAYVKKVQSETGEDPRKRWSEQEIAEEIANYVTTAFMTIENLPSSIITSGQKQPTIQTEEEMPVETQVQEPIQEPAQEPAQLPVQEPAQTPADNIAREIPATQPATQPAGGQSQI